MKKWIVSLVIVGILGFGGYKLGMNVMSQKIMDQVTDQVLSKEEINKMMQDPAIQQTLQEQIGEQGLQKIQQQAEGASSKEPLTADTQTEQTGVSQTPKNNKLVFSNREEALSFLLSKFSMNELKGFAAKAQGGLTSEEKSEIKSELMSRISPAEYEALKVLGLVELSKRKE